jgi:hypothetical protein
MLPGSLAKNLCFTNFYSTVSFVAEDDWSFQYLPDDGIPIGSSLLIVSPPNGTWIKVLYNGKIGWVNWNYLEEIWDECG